MSKKRRKRKFPSDRNNTKRLSISSNNSVETEPIKAPPQKPTLPVAQNTDRRQGIFKKAIKWLKKPVYFIIAVLGLIATVIGIIEAPFWKDWNKKPDSYNEVLIEAQNMMIEPTDAGFFRVHYNLHNLNDKNIQLLTVATQAIHGRSEPFEDTSAFTWLMRNPYIFSSKYKTTRILNKNSDNLFVTSEPFPAFSNEAQRLGNDIQVLLGGVCLYLHPETKDTFRYEYVSRIYRGSTKLLKSVNAPFTLKNIETIKQTIEENNASTGIEDSTRTDSAGVKK